MKTDVIIRSAKTKEDYASFGMLVREYIDSRGVPVDHQDVDAEMAELSSRYGPKLQGVRFSSCTASMSLALPVFVIWAKAFAS